MPQYVGLDRGIFSKRSRVHAQICQLCGQEIEQRFLFQGFGEISVASSNQNPLMFFRQGVRGERDDPRRWTAGGALQLANLMGCSMTIHAGHLDIH